MSASYSPNRKVLTLIIDSCPENTRLADWIADKLNDIETIFETCNDLNKSLHTLKRKYESDVAEVKKQLESVQKSCEHLDKTHHGDPSGGSDSFWECNICGDQFR